MGESEECMERVACEMGGLVEDAGISKSMTKMVEKFAPKKYAKMMKNSTTARTARRTISAAYSRASRVTPTYTSTAMTCTTQKSHSCQNFQISLHLWLILTNQNDLQLAVGQPCM